MAQQELAHLLAPLQVGPITLKNRIVSSAHLTHFARDHLPSDQHLYYYREKARGGLGLIRLALGTSLGPDRQDAPIVHRLDRSINEIGFGGGAELTGRAMNLGIAFAALLQNLAAGLEQNLDGTLCADRLARLGGCPL